MNIRIARPVSDVFDAIVSRDRLTRYFADESSGDLAEGDRIVWHWDAWGDYPVVVKTIETNRLIELALDSKVWQKTTDEAYEVRVVVELRKLDDGATMLSISEDGWKTDADGLTGSHDNCSGWTHMAMCLKAYLEHAIDLR